jgi:hypothetical protein
MAALKLTFDEPILIDRISRIDVQPNGTMLVSIWWQWDGLITYDNLMRRGRLDGREGKGLNTQKRII